MEKKKSHFNVSVETAPKMWKWWGQKSQHAMQLATLGKKNSTNILAWYLYGYCNFHNKWKSKRGYFVVFWGRPLQMFLKIHNGAFESPSIPWIWEKPSEKCQFPCMENCLISSNGNWKLHSYLHSYRFQTVSIWIFKFHQWKLFQTLTMENQISTANIKIWIPHYFNLDFGSPSWKLFWILTMENENSTVHMEIWISTLF